MLWLAEHASKFTQYQFNKFWSADFEKTGKEKVLPWSYSF